MKLHGFYIRSNYEVAIGVMALKLLDDLQVRLLRDLEFLMGSENKNRSSSGHLIKTLDSMEKS